MATQLTITVGQHSDRGRKESNQDFHGVCIPTPPLLNSKGIAVVLADGISSSAVSQIASEAAVTGFLEDYYSTPETWSVKRSARRVLFATNSWLHSQTRQSPYRYQIDRGYVCTLSTLVIKSATAHIFHVGDARVYRIRSDSLEQLTEDHRIRVSQGKSYLARGLGINPQLEIDYRSLPLEVGDVFVLATDGVYEYAQPSTIIDTIDAHRDDLETAAKEIVAAAYGQGSPDNLTVQIVRIEALPRREAEEHVQRLSGLPFPPPLEPRRIFDGYRIVRVLHVSSRSHIYLAVDTESGAPVVLKAPSVDLRDDPAYLERFLMEEWIARRIHSAHVLRPCAQTRKRNYVYVVAEFIDGQTLSQWMIDNPKPGVERVRGIVEQIAKGLRAFHRLEMLHQDLRPENIMIDDTGTAKIIDFGSTRVAGLTESNQPLEQPPILGTAQYSAPEYFLGESPTIRSDLFSLGVIAYQMLCGRLPYGTEVSKARTRTAQKRLHYRSVLEEDRAIPAWIDEVLRKAVHPDPERRYGELSEFLFDLRHPNQAFLEKSRPPLIERNPLGFWKSLCAILSMIVLALLIRLSNQGS